MKKRNKETKESVYSPFAQRCPSIISLTCCACWDSRCVWWVLCCCECCACCACCEAWYFDSCSAAIVVHTTAGAATAGAGAAATGAAGASILVAASMASMAAEACWMGCEEEDCASCAFCASCISCASCMCPLVRKDVSPPHMPSVSLP